MRGHWAICYCWIGLCCLPVWAQQRQISHSERAHLADARASTGPLTLSPSFEFAKSAPGVPISVPTLGSVLVAAGLPWSSTLEQAPQPVPADIACTQVFQSSLLQESSGVSEHHQFSPAAIRAAFTHENLVKMARNFAPGQPLPDAPSYVPLSKRQKFERFLHYSRSGGVVVDVLSDSLYSQATGAYPKFGGGMEGYSKRFEISVAGAEAGAFFGTFLFPTLLHQDPRYFPSRQDAISDRLAYAASRVIIGRSDDGRNVLNTSMVLSQFAQAALANAYIPYRNETAAGTIENALAGLGGMAEYNILNEFWPDIKSFLGKHHPRLSHRGRQNPDTGNWNSVAEK